MNIFSKTMVVSIASFGLSVSAMAEVTQPVNTPQVDAVVFNNDLNNTDLSYAFGGSQDLQVQAMTEQQMNDTEGAVAPVYALGAFMMGTGRFVATRYVSRSVAANAARNGSNVMVRGTSQQARSLARQAYGKNNVTRHGPSGHKSHVDYSHYQPTIRNGNNGHIFYGKRYPR